MISALWNAVTLKIIHATWRVQWPVVCHKYYAADPTQTFGPIIDHTKDALRGVLGYRLYLDLRRGWRVNLPNLEQVGLLKIDYKWLDDVVTHDPFWQDAS